MLRGEYFFFHEGREGGKTKSHWKIYIIQYTYTFVLISNHHYIQQGFGTVLFYLADLDPPENPTSFEMSKWKFLNNASDNMILELRRHIDKTVQQKTYVI